MSRSRVERFKLNSSSVSVRGNKRSNLRLRTGPDWRFNRGNYPDADSLLMDGSGCISSPHPTTARGRRSIPQEVGRRSDLQVYMLFAGHASPALGLCVLVAVVWGSACADLMIGG